MSHWLKQSFRAVGLRVVGYGTLLSMLAWLAHLYVSNPLYVKRIPYFTDAFRVGFRVDCDSTAPDALGSMLKKVSLPYFSLNGQVVYLDRMGKALGCRVNKNRQGGDGVFRFASMTKVVTAFAVMELAQKNQINLHSKVVDFFPELEKEEIEDTYVLDVTLKQLLNHSSGFGGPFGSDNMVKKGEQPWCPDNIKALESVRLAGKPGTNHVYSNVAYCLLGEVLARVTGLEFQEYVRTTYLADYPSLQFVRGPYLPEEPNYDFSNDYRFGERYVDWLDFNALASSAGLMGNPQEFGELVRELLARNPSILLDRGVDNCRERKLERCYSYPFVVIETEQGPVGIQQGYLPGASSLVAVTSDNQVLVWVAAGSALESKHKDLMVDKVVSFLTSQ